MTYVPAFIAEPLGPVIRRWLIHAHDDATAVDVAIKQARNADWHLVQVTVAATGQSVFRRGEA